MTLTVQALSLLVGVFLPIVVGIVTTRITSPGVKAVLLALLAAVTGILSEYLATPSHFNWTAAGMNWLGTFAVAVASQFGFWRPVGVTGFVQDSVGPTAKTEVRQPTSRTGLV